MLVESCHIESNNTDGLLSLLGFNASRGEVVEVVESRSFIDVFKGSAFSVEKADRFHFTIIIIVII